MKTVIIFTMFAVDLDDSACPVTVLDFTRLDKRNNCLMQTNPHAVEVLELDGGKPVGVTEYLPREEGALRRSIDQIPDFSNDVKLGGACVYFSTRELADLDAGAASMAYACGARAVKEKVRRRLAEHAEGLLE